VCELLHQTESCALPFYLQYYFAQKLGLFHVVSVPLLLLERVLERMHQCGGSGWRRHINSADGQNSLEKSFNDDFERTSAAATKQRQLLEAERAVWEHLSTSDICVLPSVLLMNSNHTSPDWSVVAFVCSRSDEDRAAEIRCVCARACRYDLLRDLEQVASLTVFPYINVECQMENKVRQISSLSRSSQCGKRPLTRLS
jgi:hypothetical protein